MLERDGRPWLLIRTNWNYFWHAFSDDNGKSWRTIYPSKIDAGSSPRLPPPPGRRPHRPRLEPPEAGERSRLPLPLLDRLRRPQGQLAPRRTFPRFFRRRRRNVDGPGRYRPKTERQTSPTPTIFEVEPGRLWVTASGNLRIELSEADFLPKEE